MKKNILLISLFLLTASAYGDSKFGANRIQKLKWSNLDVTWIEDNRFPTFDITFYFADGALSDSRRDMGITSAMFDLLESGTRRFNQKNIADNLEFFGVSFGAMNTHEYSTYKISGLSKDVIPAIKQICHLFKDATFPIKEVKKYKKQKASALKSLINSHGKLASRAFRELSLKGTPYELPADGKISHIKSINQKSLERKLKYFNEKVKKRVYLAGPKSILNIKNIVNKECGWTGAGEFVRHSSVKKPKVKRTAPDIYLVTVPKANQAQVRIGRILRKGEYENDELLTFASDYLGGGFTSRLMRELRVNRGLTYSVGAYAGGQKDYGRAGINSFTKVESAVELINVIKDTIAKIEQEGVPDKDFKRFRSGLVGGYPFRFEQTSSYLSQLIYIDHIGLQYDKLYSFLEKIKQITPEEVSKAVGKIWKWNSQSIVIVGPESLAKELKKLGKVKIINYKKLL